MHFHIPKPLHGWREFFGEVGVIVLGVLIALSAEQVVEAVHWHNQVRLGRTDLADSYTTLRLQMRERQLISPCLDRRFQQIAAILDNASETGRLPPVGDLGQPRLRTISEPIWPGLVTTGTALHFPRAEASKYNAIEAYIELWKGDEDREREAWAHLYSIVGPGRAVSQAELGDIRAALGQALFEARMLKLYSHLITQRIAAAPLDTRDWINRKMLAGIDPRHPEKILTQSPCKPIGAAPAHYGQAPMSGVDMEDANRPIVPAKTSQWFGKQEQQ
jgi:hypothetical protein